MMGFWKHVSPASTMAPFFGVSIPELDLDIKKMMGFWNMWATQKKIIHFPVYWLANRDPYIGYDNP